MDKLSDLTPPVQRLRPAFAPACDWRSAEAILLEDFGVDLAELPAVAAPSKPGPQPANRDLAQLYQVGLPEILRALSHLNSRSAAKGAAA